MKNISKKIVAGTIAASFVLGVGFVGSLHNQAFAATDSSTTQTQTAKNDRGFGGGFGNHGGRMGGARGGNIVKEAATILGTDESSIQTSLQGGKTLLDLATVVGLSEDDFVAKLVAAETASIDAKVTAGTLTQDQADKFKTNLSTSVKSQIESKSFGGSDGGFRGDKGLGGVRGGNIVKEAATILGTDESSIQTSLQGGKMLLDIATAAGLSEDDFVAKLVEAEKSSIAAQVTAGTLTQAQADQITSNLSTQLKQRIENTGAQGGGGGHSGKGNGFGGFESATTILGITQDELKTQLDAGQSIADIAAAKGISEDDLISKLKESMNDRLKQFVENKHQKLAADASNTDSAAVN
jgi:ribosomal protein S13